MPVRKPVIVNGTVLDDELIAFINLLKKRLRQDWDIVLAITGEEGSGKSTLGMLLGKLIDKRFDFEKNVSFLPDEKEIRDEFTALKKYQCYVIDEAIRSLYKMNFMSNLQQMLVQMWATERYQNKATIMIIPRFKDLTENFRNHRVKIWIHVLTRGHAIVYLRDDDPHSKDPWQFDYMERFKMKAYGRKNVATIDVAKRLSIERKMRNYLFDFTFPDLDPVDKQKYNYMKHQSRIEFIDKQAEEEKTQGGKLATKYGKDRQWLIGHIYENLTGQGKRTETMEMLCEKLSISKLTFKKYIKEYKAQQQEADEREERINSYVGVDRFLDQALALEKTKQAKPQKDWRNAGL